MHVLYLTEENAEPSVVPSLVTVSLERLVFLCLPKYLIKIPNQLLNLIH